jgi:hypothetical protein
MNTRDFYEVSEDFVRWAYELAFDKVYEIRRKRFENASDLVKDAIEYRNENKYDFIEEMLRSWCLSLDPYDDVDNWFGAEEYTYQEILTKINPWEIYTWKEDQDKIIQKWCDDNDFWYSDYYELAVANVFNY